MKTLGLILVVLGIVALAYQGVTYFTHEEVLRIGDVKVTHEERHHVPLPPILGGLALATGIILIVTGTGDRKSRNLTS